MTKRKRFPCEKCKMVKNPEACNRKNCIIWRKWWLAKWEDIRRMFGEAGSNNGKPEN